MELVLEVDHAHFVWRLFSHHARGRYKIAHQKIGPEFAGCASYPLSEGTLKVRNWANEEFGHQEQNEKSNPVFFENTEYCIDIEFKRRPDQPAHFYSYLKHLYEKFNYMIRGGESGVATYTGTIDFGNDIGTSFLELRYELDKKDYAVRLGFDVYPVKLNYHSDLQKIISDIQESYPLLALDFMKRTWRGFKHGSQITHNHIWWWFFTQTYSLLLKQVDLILARPHHRLLEETDYRKRTKIRQANPQLEEELKRHRDQPNRYYKTSRKILSADTPENRFVAHSLNEARKKFVTLHKSIVNKYQLSDDYAGQLDKIADSLTKYCNNPFWKSVGKFEGFRQESLTIQRKPGYSGYLALWTLLKKGIDLFEGEKKIEFKSIDMLYQIWCFLELRNIIREITGIQETGNYEGIIKKLNSTNKATAFLSSIDFENTDYRVKLIYDREYGKAPDNYSIRSFTGDQRPDITLHIEKKMAGENRPLTYIFDAKYRIDFRKADTNDLPPEDAINQMHRYRDSIYYEAKPLRPQKEVIGGFILFPSTEISETINELPYIKSIAEVNIGAFPLAPNRIENDVFLKRFLSERITGKVADILRRDLTGQRHITYEYPDGLVLVGVLNSKLQESYFEKDESLVYHIKIKGISVERMKEIKFFSPWKKSVGCTVFYNVTGIEIRHRTDIFERDHDLFKESDEEYMVLHLGRKYEIGHCIEPTQGNFFRYCDLNVFAAAQNFGDFKTE